MQQLSPPPSLNIVFSIFALLALGLVILAVVAVVTVMLAARRPIIPFQQIKSVAATILWIVPALAVVGLIGMKFSAARATTYHIPGYHSEFSSGIREEVRSTVRGVVDQVQSAVRQANGQADSAVRDAIAESASRQGSVVDRNITVNPERTTPISADAQQPVPIVVEAESQFAQVSPIVEKPVDQVAEDSPAAQRRRARAGSRNSSGEPRVDSLSSNGVLKVRETRVGAPDWADKEPAPGDRGILVSLSSQRFATLQEAEQQVTDQAVAYVRQFYRDEYPLPGDWTVPVAIIEKNAVHDLVGETIDKDFGNGFRGTMYLAHLRLELNSALRQALHNSWHGQIVSQRLTVLGSMLGLVTLMLATSAGYFRLDDLTGGMYRRRLKFAAASLIAAGSLVAIVVS